MNYKTTIGYHDAFLEVEVIISDQSTSKEEAESLGNNFSGIYAFLYQDEIVIEASHQPLVIEKKQTHLYQFRVCINEKAYIVTHDDYKKITWDEAQDYIKERYTNKSNTLFPFRLDSYYYGVREESKTLE